MNIILQKIIATSGYCSRRKAEEMVRSGQVKVNGRTASVGDTADPEKDKITIKNQTIKAAPTKIYIKLNKPIGYVCTNRQFAQEKNIFSLINIPTRLFAVGRLDKNSQGLVLLTNDGDLAERLAHPRFEHDKVYEVKVSGTIKNDGLTSKRLKNGIELDDGLARAKEVQYLQNNLFIITLNEGKKRQIRRMFQALGLEVVDLKRVSLGSLELGNLPLGRWEHLTTEEVAKILK